MELSNRKRIANALNDWDRSVEKSRARGHIPLTLQFRYSGYLEALLSAEGKIPQNADLQYKTFTFKRMIFPGTYEVKESYPELMYRLAQEYLRETA